MKKLFVFFVVLLLPLRVYATPAITEVSGGSLSHNESVTITGTNLYDDTAGTQNKADDTGQVAPQIWDDCESYDDKDDPVTDGNWNYKKSHTCYYSDCNMQYRVLPPTVTNSAGTTVRGVSNPHARGTKSLVAGHCPIPGETCTLDGDEGGSALVVKTISATQKVYMRAYETKDPLWPTTGYIEGTEIYYDDAMADRRHGWVMHASGATDDWNNFEFFGWIDSASILDAEHGLANACWDDHARAEDGSANVTLLDNTALKYAHCEKQAETISWSSVEALRDYNGDSGFYFRGIFDNATKTLSADACNSPSPSTYTQAQFGEWWVIRTYSPACDRAGHTDAWYYLDDLYVDSTLARVMLCNASTYPGDMDDICVADNNPSSCCEAAGLGTCGTSYVCEPQIPHTTYNDGTIQVTVNLGAITSSTGYLYVFDSDNNHNATGYEVTLDQSEFECEDAGDCDDSNPCTDDTCPAGTCVWTNNSASCDDSLYCNGTDTCSGGACGHAGDPCAEGKICNESTDSCDDCTVEDQETDCEDYNDCTNNVCTDGSCANTNKANGTSCNDGDFCTLTDTCTDGVCGGTGSPCAEGYYCNDMEQTCDLISVGHKIIFIQGN